MDDKSCKKVTLTLKRIDRFGVKFKRVSLPNDPGYSKESYE